MGQGLRRRPRHADRGGPGGAAAGPAARARRRLPRRRARGRDGRRVRLLPARQGRRGAVDRHRDARPRRRRPRRPPAPRLRHRDRHRRRRRGADQGVLRRPGRLGAWRRPGFQLGLDIAAIKRHNPQAIGCILGGHGITAWGDTSRGVRGELARHHPHRRGVPRRARQGRAVRRRWSPATSRCPRPSGAPRPPRSRRSSAAWPRTDRPAGRATSPTATSCSTSWPARAPAPLAALGTSCPDHFLRTKVPPLVLDLPATAPSRRPSPGCASCTRPTATDYAAYYERNADAGSARRCAAPTRRSCWCPASACSASARTSRPPASPASSTSTRST